MAWEKISRATESRLSEDEDFNTPHVLSKISPLGWEDLLLKQELEQNFPNGEEKGGGEAL